MNSPVPEVTDTKGPTAGSDKGARAAAIGLRVLFGIVWLIDGAFHAYAWLLPGEQSATNLLHAYSKPLATAPLWLAPYLTSVIHGIETLGSQVVAGIMVLLDVAIGLSLITGFGVVVFSVLGIAYSLFCWTTLDSLGYPYTQGQTDPGVFIPYALVFVFVLAARPFERHPFAQAGNRGAGLVIGRILFGALWAFDAALKWQPYFLTHFMEQLTGALPGQPPWIAAYIDSIIGLVQLLGPQVAAIAVAVAETLMAISLLSGRGLRLSVPLGILYSLAVWTTAEGWGGPYTSAGTGVRGNVVGNVIVYVVIFLYLWLLHVARPRERKYDDRDWSGG
jgi:uncharacterized membrane protein YphA (DoxX/SURF4 family)